MRLSSQRANKLHVTAFDVVIERQKRGGLKGQRNGKHAGTGADGGCSAVCPKPHEDR